MLRYKTSSALIALLLAGISFGVLADTITNPIFPTFPKERPIDSAIAVEELWKTYLVTDDGSLIDRIITTAALPMENLEDAAGPLPFGKLKNDTSIFSKDEIRRVAKQQFFISEARWSLGYYIARKPHVAKIAEQRRKTATGNEKAVLEFVFTHPPRATTFLGELRMEMDEQQGAKSPLAGPLASNAPVPKK